ncbi:histidine kinase [Lapillicoccus jejuensis]|uniref:Histidine kinase n=1 Tax=Lapillicoccus jejuensis TaxID=402171 RepID=A0A542DYD9_9MICO|nr:histidine kinase [Lapillicoccus jejuensis]TQJ08113.1 histidine kinase [Lapillicoccus jejuensis]
MTTTPEHDAPPAPTAPLAVTRPLEVGSPRAAVPTWVTVSRPGRRLDTRAAPTPRRTLLQLIGAVVLVLAVVVVLGSLAAARLAEREAVNDAAHTTDLIAEAVVQPALTDALASGDPTAVKAFDVLVRKHVLGDDVKRVKLWSPGGTVVYADEPRLVGRTFPLDAEQQEVFEHPTTRAEISDLSAQENQFETGGRLLEVYRPVWTSSGRPLLFEIYAPYGPVEDRATQLSRGFLGVFLSALLLLVVLLAPVVLGLARRLSLAARQRERLLEHAVEASGDERRRIAGTLHDGPVQELVATSYAVSGAAERARHEGQGALAHELDGLAGTVRGTIRALRTLLVDIYPPSLAQAGLAAALADLAQVVGRRGVQVRLDVDEQAAGALSDAQQRLIHRVAQECLRNVATHAAPCTATVSLSRDHGRTVLDVVDDGPGFDTGLVSDPRDGHYGLRVLADLAGDAGADLEVASAPGSGTHWRLALPETEATR